jgi:hypothetical protein
MVGEAQATDSVNQDFSGLLVLIFNWICTVAGLN